MLKIILYDFKVKLKHLFKVLQMDCFFQK